MNENSKRLLKRAGSFIAVVAVSAGALLIMSLIADRVRDSTSSGAMRDRFKDILSAESYEEIDIYEAGEPYSDVSAAYRAYSGSSTDGYIVELRTKGYNGDIEVTVAVNESADRVLKVKIGKNSETENLGAKISENTFISQFSNAKPPFELGRIKLSNGTYFAEAGEYSGGYRENVTITVENGRITHALWDAESESGGKSKRQASLDGEYVMTADGMLWHEQAQLMEARLLEVQSPSLIPYGDDGKTDAIAGVSISISPFVALAQKCVEQAGGRSDGTSIDGVSGATVSSAAVINAANNAVKFVSEFVLISEGGQ